MPPRVLWSFFARIHLKGFRHSWQSPSPHTMQGPLTFLHLYIAGPQGAVAMEVRIREQIITWALRCAEHCYEAFGLGSLRAAHPFATLCQRLKRSVVLGNENTLRSGKSREENETKLKDPHSLHNIRRIRSKKKRRQIHITHYTGVQGSRVFYYRHREIAMCETNSPQSSENVLSTFPPNVIVCFHIQLSKAQVPTASHHTRKQ